MPSSPSYAARDRETEGERETHGSEGRLAERPTVIVAGWLAEPLLGWLPFCWLVGGIASDCMFSWATTMFPCCTPLLVLLLPACLPACRASLASAADLQVQVCPATFLGVATTSSLPPYVSAAPHLADV